RTSGGPRLWLSSVHSRHRLTREGPPGYRHRARRGPGAASAAAVPAGRAAAARLSGTTRGRRAAGPSADAASVARRGSLLGAEPLGDQRVERAVLLDHRQAGVEVVDQRVALGEDEAQRVAREAAD